MRKLALSLTLSVAGLIIVLTAAGATRGNSVQQSLSLSGVYAGTVVITGPLGLDPFDMAIVLTDTNGSLTGYIASARLLAFPITQMTPTVQGPTVSGLRSGDSFSLHSARFTDTISTLSRQVVMHTGVISNTGEMLTGVYSETLWGLTPQPLNLVGYFSLTRPSNLPPAGVPVELHVRSAPIHIRPQGVATITAQLVDFYSQPISRTVIGFSASSGSLSPITATTNMTGEATVIYTAGAGIGPIAVSAKSGTISGATTLYSYVVLNDHVYLPLIRR